MIEILLEIIKRTLESGEDVLVSGFGKFCVKSIVVFVVALAYIISPIDLIPDYII